MLFYGPSGAGKKTRVMCTLRELFGPGVEKVSSSSFLDAIGATRMARVERNQLQRYIFSLGCACEGPREVGIELRSVRRKGRRAC